jgi:hypothetical protein
MSLQKLKYLEICEIGLKLPSLGKKLKPVEEKN